MRLRLNCLVRHRSLTPDVIIGIPATGITLNILPKYCNDYIFVGAFSPQQVFPLLLSWKSTIQYVLIYRFIKSAILSICGFIVCTAMFYWRHNPCNNYGPNTQAIRTILKSPDSSIWLSQIIHWGIRPTSLHSTNHKGLCSNYNSDWTVLRSSYCKCNSVTYLHFVTESNRIRFPKNFETRCQQHISIKWQCGIR